MRTKFEELIKNLAIQLDTTLIVDENDACLIVFDEKIEVQIELDQEEEKIIIFSSIALLPAGKFRENVLLETLKENDKFPFLGIFGYLEKENSLTYHHLFEISQVDEKILSSFITSFVERALLWKDAIEQGRSAPVIETKIK